MFFGKYGRERRLFDVNRGVNLFRDRGKMRMVLVYFICLEKFVMFFFE